MSLLGVTVASMADHISVNNAKTQKERNTMKKNVNVKITEDRSKCTVTDLGTGLNYVLTEIKLKHTTNIPVFAILGGEQPLTYTGKDALRRWERFAETTNKKDIMVGFAWAML